MSNDLSGKLTDPRNNQQSRGMGFITNSDQRGTTAYVTQQHREHHAQGGTVGDMMREQAGMGANRPVSQHLLKAMAEKKAKEYQPHGKGEGVAENQTYSTNKEEKRGKKIRKSEVRGDKRAIESKELALEEQRALDARRRLEARKRSEAREPQRRLNEQKRLMERKKEIDNRNKEMDIENHSDNGSEYEIENYPHTSQGKYKYGCIHANMKSAAQKKKTYKGNNDLDAYRKETNELYKKLPKDNPIKKQIDKWANEASIEHPTLNKNEPFNFNHPNPVEPLLNLNNFKYSVDNEVTPKKMHETVKERKKIPMLLHTYGNKDNEAFDKHLLTIKDSHHHLNNPDDSDGTEYSFGTMEPSDQIKRLYSKKKDPNTLLNRDTDDFYTNVEKTHYTKDFTPPPIREGKRQPKPADPKKTASILYNIDMD